MKRNLFLCAIFGLLLLLLPHNTRAAELLVNGGFELGNFTGWNVTNASNSFINWNVSGAGAGGGFIPVPVVTSPQEGTRVAWNGIASNAGSSYVLYQQVTLPAAQTASLFWKDRFQDNLAEFCGGSGEPVCGTSTYRVDIVNTSNVVLQNLYTVTAPANANTDTGWRGHQTTLSAYAGQTIRLRFMTTPTVTWDGPGQIEIDAVSLQSPAVPTAANVNVSGKVLTNEGAGISRVNVTLTNGAGVSRAATTNNFGYYNFDNVAAGETYIITVNNKKYLFTNSPRVLNVQNDVTDADFVASP